MEVDEGSTTECQSLHINRLLDDSQAANWFSALKCLKNDVIGSDRQKNLAINSGLIPRLLSWIENGTPDLKTESAIILASLSKGNDESIACLVENQAVPVLLKSLSYLNLRFSEAILRCIRSICMNNSDFTSTLYTESDDGCNYIPLLLSMVQYSPTCQECVTSILEHACQTTENQHCLLDNQALQVLSPLLQSTFYKVQMPTLRFFANLCFKNPIVCKAVMSEERMLGVFLELMSRDKPSEMQMAAARVLTYLHRSDAIPATDFVISRKTLGTLVRMCKRDRTLEENVEGAKTLAYLTEVDPQLQVTASITDHLISTLADYLNYKDVKKVNSFDKKEVDWGTEMKKAAFLAFSSISANDEEIREKVIKKEGMVESVLTSLNSSDESEVLASLRCLHSLTRSVQQVRTVLNDTEIWRPLFQKVQSGNKDMQILAICCVCNLLLEFSPSKEELLTKTPALEVLCGFCNSPDDEVRLNAVWSLMSMTYYAPEDLRIQVLETLTTATVVLRLQDSEPTIREKALGIVRNLLTSKASIDKMVKTLGGEVFEAIFDIFKQPGNTVDVVEQALCVLSNMADGPSCKNHIIEKTDVMQQVIKYLQHPEPRLQIPTIMFIQNLVDSTDDSLGPFPHAGSYQRMLALKNMGVHEMMESLLSAVCSEVQMRAEYCLKSFA